MYYVSDLRLLFNAIYRSKIKLTSRRNLKWRKKVEYSYVDVKKNANNTQKSVILPETMKTDVKMSSRVQSLRKAIS